LNPKADDLAALKGAKVAEIIKSIDPDILDRIRQIREDLHQHPELAFREKRTAAIVVEQLTKASIEIVAEGMATTGVVGLLRTSRPGRCVALRADMDALPVEEETQLAYQSQNPGVMHACGHDGHCAVLLGAAKVLAGMRDSLCGSVKFIFQPGEEKSEGARLMVEAGVLTCSQAVQAIFGLHARPQIQAGQIELDVIPNAATNPFQIRIKGQGTHAAYPHQACDPIAIGSQIVCALQQVVSRRVAPYEAAVVTVGAFQAGSRGNIIPDQAILKGTIRTRQPAVQKTVVAAVRSIATGVARAMGAECEIEIEPGTPRLRNDEKLLELVRQVGAETLGAEDVLEASMATMGGEDFSQYLEEQGGVPGCMFRLGVETDAPIHTAKFDFGQAALEPGILMMSNVAIRYLSDDNQV